MNRLMIRAISSAKSSMSPGPIQQSIETQVLVWTIIGKMLNTWRYICILQKNSQRIEAICPQDTERLGKTRWARWKPK